MKVALIGYGVMGKQIEAVCKERGHVVSAIITKESSDEMASKLKHADVAIEFTEPDVAADNIRACFNAGVPVVCGTTGWLHHFEAIRQDCLSTGGGLLYASNFSIGVNLFFRLNKQLAALISRYPGYKAELEEIHHTRKKDAPSGTAITLAEGLIEEHPGYSSWVLGRTSAEGQLPVTASRVGDVPGTHSISWKSENDSITITHEAFNRKGFALGAVIAAEFIKGKRGVYSMTDLFNSDTDYGN